MTFEDEIKNNYFEWLYDYVCIGRVNKKVSYKKLFIKLHDTEFIFPIRNDINRARDGIDLRYRYAMSIDNEDVLNILNTNPCSVLEMLVALAIRCEETIMDDPRYGNRTGQWFWNMLTNLNINRMTDNNFNREYIEKSLYVFLNRRYDPDGKGGLFYIKNCKDDLRNVELWIQLCWYLDNFA